MDARFEKCLIRVNVAEPCNIFLVQQPAFDGSLPAIQAPPEFSLRHFESIRTQRSKDLFHFLASAIAQTPKPAYVAVSDLFRTAVQHQTDVGVRRERNVVVRNHHLAGHSQAQQEISRLVTVGRSQAEG